MKTRTGVSNLLLVGAVLCLFLGCAAHRLNYTKGESTICEVHHLKMIKTVVPVHYGLMTVTPRNEAMDSARSNGFPNAADSLNPGCTVRRQREALVYTCPECVKTRIRWQANYDSRK
jgi:hypothetical protein